MNEQLPYDNPEPEPSYHDGQGPLKGEPKPGNQTSEYKLSVIMTAVISFLTFLVSQQVLTDEQGSFLVEMVRLLFPVFGLVVIGWIVTSYTRLRTELKQWYIAAVEDAAEKRS